MVDLQFVCHLFLLSAGLLPINGAVINSTDGTFNITGNGVGGEGTYSVTNGTTEVGLHLVIAPMKEKQQVTQIANKNAMSPVSMASQKDERIETEITFNKEDEEFLDEMLEEHNKLRSIHLAPPLLRNINMSLQAKALATQLAAEANLRHSDKRTRQDQGENLAMGCTSSGPGISAKDAAKEWYDEVCSHNFFNQAYQDKSGHFSQLIWNATRELGVGKATGTKFGMNCTFIVARYRPLGNIGSEFANDVSKGHFDSSYCTNVQRDQLPRVGEDKTTLASRNFRYRTKIPRMSKIVIL